MNQEIYEQIREAQQASLFRAVGGDGCAKVVDSPFLGDPIASAFERIARFEDPAIEVGRLGVHEVHLVGAAFDAVRDGLERLGELRKWNVDGAINVRRMAGGRC